MILAGFFWFGAMLAIWLSLAAILKYAVPDSVAGRVALTLT